MQQGLERCQQQHEQGHALLPGNPLELPHQPAVQFDVRPRPGMTLQRWPRPVGRQFQHRLFAAQLRGPVRQLPGLLAGLHPVALPVRIVDVLERQGLEPRRLALAAGDIAFDQFVDHDRHRPAIGDDMVQGHHQHMSLFAHDQQPGPQQRPLLQVEWGQDFAADARHDRLRVGLGAVQRLDHQLESRCRVHDLHSLAVLLAEGGAQGFVTGDQRFEAAPQRLPVKATVQAQGGRDVVGRVIRLQLPEEPLPLLGIGQAQRPGAIRRGESRCPVGAGLPGTFGETGEVAGLEQAAQGQLNTKYLARPGNHLGRQQRVSTQFEKVVAQAHLSDLQHLAPDGRQLLFEGAARRDIGLLQQRRIGSRQGLAVELAVGRQGQGFQEHQVRRHHVVGQVQLEIIPQFGAQRRLLPDVVHKRRPGRHQVGHQLCAGRPVHGQDCGLAHLSVALQAGFDFPQFDAETADLDLMIAPPDVVDHTIGTHPRQIAGAVESSATRGVEGIGHEPAGRQARLVQVAARQAGAGDIQFADATRRGQVQGIVQQVPGQIDDRLADGAARRLLQVSQGQRPIGHVDRGLGNTVHVDQGRRAVAEALEPRTQALHFQGFAPKHDMTQGQLARRLDRHRHQRLEGRRCLVEHGHPLIAQQGMERLRRTADIVGHHHQPAAMEQGAEDFPDGKIEGIGVEQRPGIGAAEVEPVIGGAEQTQHVAMGQQRALGVASGARGVDHVGQVIDTDRTLGVARPLVFGWAVQVQAFDAGGDRQLRQQMPLGQQQLQAAVADHVAQAFVGVGRIQRHIGAAGLEHRDQGNDHLQRTFRRHAHQHIGPHTPGNQLVRPLVGPGIEFTIGQLPAGTAHGDGVRLLRGPFLDQLMQATADRVFQRRRVPPGEDLLLLGRIQQRKLGDPLARVLDNRPQQARPVLRQALDGGGVEQVGGVLQHGFDTMGLFAGVEHQVELGGLALPLQRLEVQAGHPRGEIQAAFGLVVEHHLEQRAVAQVAARLQRLDQLLERQVLVGLGLLRGLPDLLQQIDEALLAVDLGLEHLGVDEKADQAFDFGALAVGHRYTDTDIGLAAVAMQQGLERRQQQGEQGDALAAGQGLEPFAHVAFEGQVAARPGKAPGHRARMIRGQLQHRLLTAQLLLPVGQLALLLAGLHPVALPQRIVGILDRQRRQVHRAPLAEAKVQLHQLFDHHLQRPAIGNDMVQRQHQHLFLGGHLQQGRTHQGAAAQVEGRLAVVLDKGLDLRVAIPRRQRLDRQAERPGGQHHLQGLLLHLGKHRAQGLVTRHQGLQTALQRRHIELALQAQRHGDVVGRALRCPLPEEPLALLSVGQAQRFFRRALEHRRDFEQVDALLLEQSGQAFSLHRRELPYRLD